MIEISPNHFHWIFNCTNTGQIDPVDVTVLGYLDEQSARDAVKDLVKRDKYTLVKVWECNICKYQNSIMESQSKVANFLKSFIG